MFTSKKTLKENNSILFQRNTQLNKCCVELQKKNKELENLLIIKSEQLEDKKKECKKLKTLLTKNNIEYRKEN